MAKISNPYLGTYSPAGLRLNKNDIIKGLKSVKVRAPNRKYSTAPYKSGLPKDLESEPQ